MHWGDKPLYVYDGSAVGWLGVVFLTREREMELSGGQLGLLYWLKCALQKLIRDVDSGRCRGV